MTTVTLAMDGRAVTWILAEDGGWDAWVHPTGDDTDSEERMDLDALSFSGVTNQIARLFTHPEVLVTSR